MIVYCTGKSLLGFVEGLVQIVKQLWQTSLTVFCSLKNSLIKKIVCHTLHYNKDKDTLSQGNYV
jgi:hypothetical protein